MYISLLKNAQISSPLVFIFKTSFAGKKRFVCLQKIPPYKTASIVMFSKTVTVITKVSSKIRSLSARPIVKTIQALNKANG